VVVHVERSVIGGAFAGGCGAELLMCEHFGIEEGAGREQVAEMRFKLSIQPVVAGRTACRETPTGFEGERGG
jgi:hypothetical protein